MESFLSVLVSFLICRVRFACMKETARHALLPSWVTMSVFTSLCRRLAFDTLARPSNGGPLKLPRVSPCEAALMLFFFFFFPLRCYPWAKLFSSCLLTSSPLSQDLLCLKIRSPSTVRMVLPHRGSACFMFRWHRYGQCAWCYRYCAQVLADGFYELVLHHVDLW